MLETALLLSPLWLRVRGYPFLIFAPLFGKIRYSDRRRWLMQKPNNRSKVNKTIVFKTTHARIKHATSQMLPDLDCTVCHKSTVTSAYLCK